jgi:hypothetical protein
MTTFMALLKRLFCRHRSLQFVRNIHGDEIREHGWARSLWRCADCQAVVSRDDFNHGPLVAIMEAAEHLTSDELYDAAEYLRSEWAVRKQRTEDIAALQKALNFWKAAYYGAREDKEAQ